MLVLDTHVWIWLVAGDPTLSAGARDAIEAAAADGSVLVPAISVWEVALLESRGRVVLDRPCTQWVSEALAVLGRAGMWPSSALEINRRRTVRPTSDLRPSYHNNSTP